MPQTSRELVTRCLRFENPERIPRQMWALPWAEKHFPREMAAIRERFPADIAGPKSVYRPSPRCSGDRHGIGTSVDEWGCVFENVQDGVHGEVKNPVLADIADWKSCKPPYETLPEDAVVARDEVNRFCAETDFFAAGGCCARPWERMQFLHGSANSMMAVMMPDEGARDLLRVIHEFYLKELEFWVSTDVDAVNFMDDWGSQRQLLIPPPVWRELFRPLYKDYCDLAHANGKFIFMHSDGCIAEIYDDIVEIGVDALNSQLFTMDMADLARRAKGKITFWGEIDRQHVMPAEDPQVARDAVREVARHLYDPRGGIIAQFEISPGSRPANAVAIFEEWEKVHAEATGKA